MFVVFVGFFRVVFVQIFVSVFVAEMKLFRLRIGHFGDVKRRDFIAFLAFHNVAFYRVEIGRNAERRERRSPRAVGVRLGENVREAEPEQITGKDNLSSVLRQERKAKKRAVGDERRDPRRRKDAESSARSFLFYALRRFWKAEERKISAKFPETLDSENRPSRFDVKKRRPESLRTSAFDLRLNRRFRRACVRRR